MQSRTSANVSHEMSLRITFLSRSSFIPEEKTALKNPEHAARITRWHRNSKLSTTICTSENSNVCLCSFKPFSKADAIHIENGGLSAFSLAMAIIVALEVPTCENLTQKMVIANDKVSVKFELVSCFICYNCRQPIKSQLKPRHYCLLTFYGIARRHSRLWVVLELRTPKSNLQISAYHNLHTANICLLSNRHASQAECQWLQQPGDMFDLQRSNKGNHTHEQVNGTTQVWPMKSLFVLQR